MRLKVLVVVALSFLLLAGVAEAHKLPYGLAKTTVKRFTAGICKGTEGCRNWRVTACQRKSDHRIDCLSTLVLPEASCSWVTIALAPRNLYEVRIHHKRITC
jgi:hypothetical protein